MSKLFSRGAMSFASGLEDNIFAEVGEHSGEGGMDKDEVVQTPPPSPDSLLKKEEGKPG